jgi:eukaryotic-like serine/threonine-protein kinase
MIDQTISNYKITSLIGQGGMGAVYEAVHQVLGRKAAIKFVHPQYARNEDVVSRFFNEARAAGLIQHPGIVEVFDVGRTGDGVPYLVMEMLGGRTLGQTMRSRRLSLDEVVVFGCQIASTLGAAHDKGIVHRDLKPENLYLINRYDGSIGVKILDFGIAKLRDDVPHSNVVTRTGHILGTPLYMSPEQCRGVSREIDHRTDIYSLGIVLYEALAGRPPFNAEGSGELIVQHLQAPPPPLTEIPPPLAAVVMRALAKRPDDRHESMQEFEAALAEAGGFEAPQPGPRPLRIARTPSSSTLQRTSAPPSTPWRTPAATTEGPKTTLSGSATGIPLGGPPHRVKKGRKLLATLALSAVAAGAFFALGGKLPAPLRTIGSPTVVSGSGGPSAEVPAVNEPEAKPPVVQPPVVKEPETKPSLARQPEAKPEAEAPPEATPPPAELPPRKDVVPATGVAAKAGLKPAVPSGRTRKQAAEAAKRRKAAMEAW